MGKYRTGRRNNRTIYYQSGPEPSDADEFAGFAADSSWAVALVAAANRGLASIEATETPAEPTPGEGGTDA